jgi:hypothetical protein
MKQYRSLARRCISITVLYAFLFVFNASLCKSGRQNAGTYYLMNFGGLYLSQSINVLGLIEFFVPNLFFIYMFSDLWRSECVISYVYVFTRSGNKQKWLFHKALQLFFCIAIVYLWLLVFAFAVGKAFALPNLTDVSFAKLILPLYFLNMLTLYEFAFLQNSLSMKNGNAVSFFVTIILYILPAIIILILNKSIQYGAILYFILPANQMYLWHADHIMINGSEISLSGSIQNYFLFPSMLALTAFIIVSYLVYRRFFIKKDMTELIME